MAVPTSPGLRTARLGVGMVGLAGAVVVAVGAYRGDTMAVVVGASALLIAGGAMAALSSADSDEADEV